MSRLSPKAATDGVPATSYIPYTRLASFQGILCSYPPPSLSPISVTGQPSTPRGVTHPFLYHSGLGPRHASRLRRSTAAHRLPPALSPPMIIILAAFSPNSFSAFSSTQIAASSHSFTAAG